MCLMVGLCVGIKAIRKKGNEKYIGFAEENVINENDIAENEEIIEDTDVKKVIDEENQDNDNVELKEESKIEIQQKQEKDVTNKNTKKEVVIEKVKEETKVNTENKNTQVQEKNVNKVSENTEVKVDMAESKKIKEPEKTKCTDSKHGVGVGNSNKWFSSKQDAINYYQGIIKTFGDKWEKFEIDDETYQKNCPYGYETWSCPFCEKWTINFYYN